MSDRAEEYHFFKSIGICVRCHKVRAEPNKVFCWQCSERAAEYYKDSREKNIEERRRMDREKYYELKGEGICVRCKHEKAATEKTTCSKCLSKIRNRRNRKKCDIDRSERVAHGICYICGKESVMDGKGVCEKCYEVRMRSMEKIMYLPGNNEWKNDNKLIFQRKKA